jgi:aldose 1-epimerase
MMTRAFTLAILICMATALPASAQYTARKNGDVVELQDAKNQTVVSIIPSVGNIAFEMKVKGINVLRWPYASVEDFKARPSTTAIPFLGPWANRLDEQAFYANGKRYAFDMDLGNVRGAIPIHGFLTTTDQWQLVEAKADGKSAWVTSRLDFYKHPQWMKQWPFAHTIEMTHRLQDGVLQVETKITNLSVEPMPVSVGFHPYYRLTDSPREEWMVSVPVKTHWLLAPTKAPTGETEPAEKLFPNPQAIALKDYNLDDVFTDLARDAQGRAHFIVKGKQQQLDVMFGPNWNGATIYAPNPANTGLGSQAIVNPNAPARAAAPPANPPAQTGRAAAPAAGRGGGGGQNADPNWIAFEPTTGMSNGLNLAQKGLYKEQQYIQPGATWVASFWVKPTGF